MSKSPAATATLDSPIGPLGIHVSDSGVTGIHFSRAKKPVPQKSSHPILRDCQKQLKEYFAGKRTRFDLPLDLHGTGFQKRVWRELVKIPPGKTISYSELARRIGNPKACRAVGQANNKNPVPLLVPCHRVIGKNGDLVGFAGHLDIKFWLLEHECRIAGKKPQFFS